MIISDIMTLEMEVDDIVNSEKVDLVFCNSVMLEIAMAKYVGLITESKYDKMVLKLCNKLGNIKETDWFNPDKYLGKEYFMNNFLD